MTRAAFIRDTTDWINTRLVPAGATIDADTPLFEGGLIDSLKVLRLIAWTERAIGRPIPDAMIRMDHFRDIRHIAHTFLEDR